MNRIILLASALSLFFFANSWAQGTDEANTEDDSLMVNIADYGLLYQDKPKENRSPSQMPIYNPKQYEDKGFVWTPSEKWLYNMPVIGASKQDSSRRKSNK
ncbi:hypothetical protein SAMN05443144_101268 [Fodinibius roseus]|uniref:Uncharacterized protein n=1 Tax=Fodinibius roseus TaxID=1194090 RepID=A0A1M4TDV3_9BACT|nr:hypothetical protein [Fodinibius roseus]SHE42467.1 hypothetical protein SAMN05443144_101268 [Fodinibius roseus]